MTECQQWRK